MSRGGETQPVIEAIGLTKAFGRLKAIDGLDLVVPRGCVLGYLGPNGAGKTTTIKLVTGLWRPSAGHVIVLGHDATHDRDLVQARLGYLPGDFQGYPGMTGRRFLRLLGSLRGGVDPSHVTTLVDRLHVDLERRIGTLSHGNRQKIGIIQAFMHRPELLVLDEPTLGLDPLMQREFLAMVREARDAGSTVLLSSHILSEVAAVADRVAVINEGRLILDESVPELRAHAPRRVDLLFALEAPERVIRRFPAVQRLRTAGATAEVTVAGPLGPLLEAVSSYGLVDVISHEADLADVFLGLYDRREVDPDGLHLRQGALGAAS